MKLIKYILIVLPLVLMSACADNDTFSTLPGNRLTFSCDTVSLDTVFSKVPSSTRTLWVYNNSGDGLRCSSIKLLNGNQTGFRVNVNGVYLGDAQGYQLSNEEIRKGDSIRIFIEATLPVNNTKTPQMVTDDVVFTLESGVQQKVNLKAWSWDADMLRNVTVSADTILSSDRPIVIYDGLTVNHGATMTIPAGTTLYMHSGAYIDVHGRMVCLGEAGNEVVLRGDRLDNMFDYLKYDGVSGQWGGIRIHEGSYENVLQYTDIHATENAVVCDSDNIDRKKLTISSSTIHNAKGYGLSARNCRINIDNTQITNTLYNSVNIMGGATDINSSTLAQFYPFDGNRGAALFIEDDTTSVAPMAFNMRNSIVTGYASDVLFVERRDTTSSILFDHCLLRTPEVADTLMCRNIVWENPEDTVSSGWKNFVNIDTKNLRYDFRLKAGSLAIDAADPLTSLPLDRNATKRDDTPDMGCYEYEPEAKEE